MRTYEETHAWLTFSLDVGCVTQKTLLLLGEAASKCAHIAGVPLKPNIADDLHRLYLAKGIGGTTAIEGNSLTESQVRDAIGGKLKLPLSQEYLQKEVQNVSEACGEIGMQVVSEEVTLTPEWIKHLNAMVLKDLPREEHVEPGVIRKYSVGVFSYRGAPAEDCEFLLARMCEWFNDWPKGLWGERSEVATAVLKAVVAHVYIAWIHPFGDGNGRTARLLEYYFLANAGVPSPAAHLLSNHYNLTRAEYYRHLDKTSKSISGFVGFIEYAAAGLVDGLVEQLEIVRTQQWLMAWRDYVYDAFRGQRSEGRTRQRDLVLALGDRAWQFVPRKALAGLTPDLARRYAKTTSRTLSRDLNTLVERGLILRSEDGFRARVENVLAFLPPRKRSEEELEQAKEIIQKMKKAGMQLDLFGSE